MAGPDASGGGKDTASQTKNKDQSSSQKKPGLGSALKNAAGGYINGNQNGQQQPQNPSWGSIAKNALGKGGNSAANAFRSKHGDQQQSAQQQRLNKEKDRLDKDQKKLDKSDKKLDKKLGKSNLSDTKRAGLEKQKASNAAQSQKLGKKKDDNKQKDKKLQEKQGKFSIAGGAKKLFNMKMQGNSQVEAKAEAEANQLDPFNEIDPGNGLDFGVVDWAQCGFLKPCCKRMPFCGCCAKLVLAITFVGGLISTILF